METEQNSTRKEGKGKGRDTRAEKPKESGIHKKRIETAKKSKEKTTEQEKDTRNVE